MLFSYRKNSCMKAQCLLVSVANYLPLKYHQQNQLLTKTEISIVRNDHLCQLSLKLLCSRSVAVYKVEVMLYIFALFHDWTSPIPTRKHCLYKPRFAGLMRS